MFQRQWKQAQRPRKTATKSRSAGRKPTVKKKPAWDNTTSDLTVHQLSKEELELRRSRIMSKNAERAKRELDEMARDMRQLSSGSSQRSSGSVVEKPSSSRVPKKESILQSLLEGSDQTASVAKDLFHDDPRRYSGQPNVTVAPHVTKNKASLQRTLLENRWDGPDPSAFNSPGGIRDESVLGLAPAKRALNDLPSPSSELSLDESGFDASSLMVTPPTNSSVNSYQPRVVDLPRFQQIVDECGKDEDVGVGDGGKRGDEAISEELSSFTGSQQQAGSTVESTVDLAEGAEADNRKITSEQLWNQSGHPLQIVHKMTQTQTVESSSASQQSVGGVNPPPGPRVMSRNQRLRRLPPRQSSNPNVGSNRIYDDLTILQKLVENLERELQEYEETSGFSFPVKKPMTKQNGTFTSLTVSLLASVTKLTHYLKQSEVQLKGEVAVRNQLLHAMAEQQNLMDALTADVVKLQEENTSLKSSFQQLEASTIQQTKSLQEDVLELREKLCALEQAKPKPVPVKDSSTSTFDCELQASSSSKSPSVILPQSLSLSQKLEPNLVYSNISSTLSPSFLSEDTITPTVTVSTTSQGTSFIPPSISNFTGLTPTLSIQSTKPFLPSNVNGFSPHPWSTTGPGMESTPLLYQTPPASNNNSLSFTPTPHSVVSASGPTPDLSMATTLSPSDIDVSHLPLNLAPKPLLAVPCTVPISTLTGPVQLNPLPSYPPVSIQYLQSLPFTSTGPPLPPVSLPYSWEPPTPKFSVMPMDENLLAGTLKSGQAAIVSRPDLSFSVTSPLPAPTESTTSSTYEVSPSQSESSFNLDSSLARMSSLARSVLQELAHNRGHLAKNIQPPYSSPLASLPENSLRATTADDTQSIAIEPSLASTDRETVEATLTQVSSLSHN